MAHPGMVPAHCANMYLRCMYTMDAIYLKQAYTHTENTLWEISVFPGLSLKCTGVFIQSN